MSTTDGTRGPDRDDQADTAPTGSTVPTGSSGQQAPGVDSSASRAGAPTEPFAAPDPTVPAATAPYSSAPVPAAPSAAAPADAAYRSAHPADGSPAASSAAPAPTPGGASFAAPADAAPPTSAGAAPHPAVFPGPARSARRRKTVLIASIATVAVLGVGGQAVASVAYVSALADRLLPDSSSSSTTGDGWSGAIPDGTLPDGRLPGFDPGTSGRYPGGNDGQADTQSTQTDATASTADEEVGVVTIFTTIGYDDAARAAGTGMVMTADGFILTNNHVIDGSTSIDVTVESTGKSYTAELVGTDATADVAVLKLDDASGLDTVAFDSDDALAVGDDVYSVGNASGTGDLVTASGSVTGLDQSIQVQNESSGVAESLAGLIEVDSDVVPGDSGGPLFDADGDVIGIITAASSGSTTITGYAIDIDDARAVVRQIEAGTESATVQIGYPAFLGIELSAAPGTTTSGVAVGGVIAGMPAAAAGLAAGDVITAVDGTAVATSDALSALIAGHEPGDTVSVTWTTATGVSQTAAVTLVEGPA